MIYQIGHLLNPSKGAFTRQGCKSTAGVLWGLSGENGIESLCRNSELHTIKFGSQKCNV